MRKKSLLIPIMLIFALCIPTIASATSFGYSFNIIASVTGTKKHKLNNDTAKTTVTGNTYNQAGNVSSSKSTFTVGLQKLLTTYTDPIAADGFSHTKTIGKVSSGSYVVVVNKHSAKGYRVKGSGKIIQ